MQCRIFTGKEIADGKALFGNRPLKDESQEIHCCKVKIHHSYLHGMVQVPEVHYTREKRSEENVPLLGQGHAFRTFSFYVSRTELVFLDQDDVVSDFLQQWEKSGENLSSEEILYRLMMSLIDDDIIMIDWIYRQLAMLEGEIPKDNTRFFLQRMSSMKQTIYQMFRYYHQLAEFAQDLMEGKKVCFEEERIACFSEMIQRTGRLAEEVEVMREYANEVWEIYQAQINIRQNDIMKVLTIVTTIFLPLSLLAGWYGMNFQYMPELSWKYGYLFAAALSAAIILFCLVIFKKKRYW